MAKKKSAVETELWERQPGESAKAFEAFCIYRDMGVSRSARKVSEKLGKSRQLLSRWSAQYSWVDRVDAWDAEQDRLNRIQQQKEIAKMRKKHADLGAVMVGKAVLALSQLKLEEMSASDIARFAIEGTKIERISRGDVSEVIEERDGGTAEPAVTFYMPDNHRD